MWGDRFEMGSNNHLVELAIAAGAELIITRNTRDFKSMELHFPGIRILTPEEFLNTIRNKENLP